MRQYRDRFDLQAEAEIARLVSRQRCPGKIIYMGTPGTEVRLSKVDRYGIWIDEMVDYVPPYDEFKQKLDHIYTQHHSRGVANRRRLLLASTIHKGVGHDAEVL